MKLYDTSEAARLCDREASHIRRLCKVLGIGKVQPFSRGRRRLLTRKDVRELQLHISASNGDRKRRIATGL